MPPKLSSYDFGKVEPVFPLLRHKIFPAQPSFDRTLSQIAVITCSVKNGNRKIPIHYDRCGKCCALHYSVQYQYHPGGAVAQIGYPSGLKVFYRQNASGQLSQIDVQEPGKNKAVTPFVTALSYTALNQHKAWRWNSGDAASRTFDADGRMTGNEFAAYGYDAASRLTSITQNLWAQNMSGTYNAPLSWSAGYDSRNRLTSFSRNDAATRYSYDANSNRLSAIEQTSSDTDLDGDFDQADYHKIASKDLRLDSTSNKLLGFSQTLSAIKGGKTVASSTSQTRFSLDQNGNLTSDGLRQFDYDATNRLVRVQASAGNDAAKVSYLHNALGQRVFKSEPQHAQTTPTEAELGTDFIRWLKQSFDWLFAQAPANATLGQSYVYDDRPTPNLLGEYGNGGSQSKGGTEYIWLPTEDGQSLPVGLYRGARFYAVHSDHLGTPRLISDEASKPVWQWPYSAFGDNKPTGILKATTNPKAAMTNQPVLLKATVAMEVNLRYAGQYFDEESNFSYNYFRSYQPNQGRYTQADPIGLAGRLNRYSYVEGNPLSYSDPLGLWRNPSDIYDDAMRDARRSGLPGPHNGPQDAYRHCLASCEMARENTEAVAQCLGWANEKRGDWWRNQERGERQMDDFNNSRGFQFGRTAQSYQSCQNSCMGAATSGGLRTYTPGTTPGYW